MWKDSARKVSAEIQKNLDYNLAPAEIAAVKTRLADLRLRMVGYHVDSIPADESGRKALLAFANDLNVETIITAAVPASLSALDQLAGQSGINVAIEAHGNPKTVLDAIGSSSPRIGVAVDFGSWMEQGIRPDEGLSSIRERLMVMTVRDHSALGKNCP